jgi:hypothetical protein
MGYDYVVSCVRTDMCTNVGLLEIYCCISGTKIVLNHLPSQVQPRCYKGALGFGTPSLSSNILFCMAPADGHNSDLEVKVGSIGYSNPVHFHNLCLGGKIRAKQIFLF